MIFSIIKSKFKNIVSTPSSKSDYRYLFPQQKGDSACHCFPFINLDILHKLRTKYGSLDQVSTASPDWFTDIEWLGKTHSAIASWQTAIEQLTNPAPGRDHFFRDYQDQIVIDGISMESIYTKSGKQYYKSSFNPLKNIERYFLTPYNFINPSKHPAALRKNLPIFFDGEHEVIFNRSLNKYQPLPEYSAGGCLQNCIYLSATKKNYVLTKSQQDYLKVYAWQKPYASKSKNNKFKISYSLQLLPEKASSNIYFHVGLYQVILFALGVDKNNELINEQHPDYLAHKNLMEVMCSMDDNPWKLQTFKKENLLEYHLTEIFKERTDLAEKAKITGKCFFSTYEHYEKFDELYNSKDLATRKKLSECTDYLPGDLQILAYSFSQTVRITWAAAMGRRAFRDILELPKILLPLTYLPGLYRPSRLLKKAYQVNEQLGCSLIDVWKEILPLLRQRLGENKDIVTFDGHGAVLSFANDVLNLQAKGEVEYPDVLADLQFGIIDSLYDSGVKPFYRKRFSSANLLPSGKLISAR